MLRLKFTLKVLGLACAAGLCLGASFTWTAGGEDDYWTNGNNWEETGIGDCLYPCTTNDDATIPYVSGGYTVVLTEEVIDDLTIAGSVTFSSPSGTPALVVESLNIGAASAETVITISGATISVP